MLLIYDHPRNIGYSFFLFGFYLVLFILSIFICFNNIVEHIALFIFKFLYSALLLPGSSFY